MTVLAHTMRRATTLATLAAACSAVTASAQVATTPGYAAPPTTPVVAYTAPPTGGYAQHPMHSTVTSAPAYGQPVQGYAAQTQPVAQPAYGQPAYGQPAYQQPAYQQPAYTAPRVAAASPAITPPTPQTTPITSAAAPATPAIQASHAPVVNGHPVVGMPPETVHATPSWESYSGAHAGVGCAQPACGDTACGADSCGVGVGAGACDLGLGIGKRRNRQWFGGLYYLLLDRVDDSKQQVAYMTDTSAFGGSGDDYYYQPSDACLHTDEADFDALHGAEIRFGSTFGPTDPCTCNRRFAWELAYWGLDTADADAWLLLDGAVSSTFNNRIYGTLSKAGLRYDLDGTGVTYTDRPGDEYHDRGVPADDDLFANDVRILGMRVRRRFSAQNLELNFWRFGPQECGAACGGGVCGGGCGASCGADCGGGVCGTAACRPSRPPRRFFINGLAGIRYFRVDDDLGIDTQFTLVDGVGDPQGGWGDTYSGFADEIGTIIEDYEVDNQLVGFQLGCSMNWLVGCKWNFFADTNFGIYGNNAEVYKRVFLGGGGTASYAGSGDSFSFVRDSETNLAFLGELRTGVAYQVTCNCRLSAAYRLIGAGGLALSHSQIPQNYANGELVAHVSADDSLILHGLQLGAEYSY